MEECLTKQQRGCSCKITGEVQCEQPNNSLYTFTGNLILDKQTLPVNPNQLLLRRCSLRNTEYIVGTVIYTGHETKVMMNTMNVPSKRSTLERKLDKLILALFATLFMMCFIGAVGSGILINKKYYYLGLQPPVDDHQFDPSNRFFGYGRSCWSGGHINVDRPLLIWIKDHGMDKGYEEATPAFEALKEKSCVLLFVAFWSIMKICSTMLLDEAL